MLTLLTAYNHGYRSEPTQDLSKRCRFKQKLKKILEVNPAGSHSSLARATRLSDQVNLKTVQNETRPRSTSYQVGLSGQV